MDLATIAQQWKLAVLTGEMSNLGFKRLRNIRWAWLI